MNLGYIRVSSNDQKIDRQLEKMKNLFIDDRYIFIDKQSGKNFDRPQYKNMKKFIREGDLIYIDALDRLGRNYEQVIEEWKYITRDLKADIIILENPSLFDSRKFKSMGDMGKLMEDQFLSLLSYVADQERKKIKSRQREGIKAAKEKGVKFGRPKYLINDKFIEIYNKWSDGKIKAVEAMKLLNMGKTTFYRKVKEYKSSLQCDKKNVK